MLIWTQERNYLRRTGTVYLYIKTTRGKKTPNTQIALTQSQNLTNWDFFLRLRNMSDVCKLIWTAVCCRDTRVGAALENWCAAIILLSPEGTKLGKKITAEEKTTPQHMGWLLVMAIILFVFLKKAFEFGSSINIVALLNNVFALDSCFRKAASED